MVRNLATGIGIVVLVIVGFKVLMMALGFIFKFAVVLAIVGVVVFLLLPKRYRRF